MKQNARRHLAPALALLVLVGAAAPAAADEIVLANGRRLEGKAERVGDEVVVRARGGEMRLAAKEVVSITKGPTKDDLYAERTAKLDAKDVAQQIAVADWCRDQALPDLEKKHLRAVLAVSPDHQAVRARLGFLRYEGRWVTEAEYYTARGFVRVGREWVSKDEVDLRTAERDAKSAMDAHMKKIRECIGRMSSPRRATRKDGKFGLQQYAEKIGDPGLAQFATQVAGYYNEAWRAVKAEWEGTATLEVRATKAELKRPIPTIETSLGAFSTPVRIQLPEMSIVSVKTTVRVPITIELDEE